MADELLVFPQPRELTRYVKVDLKNHSYRITLPKSFARTLGIEPQDNVRVVLLGNRIEITKAD